jgi:hypothetical protein
MSIDDSKRILMKRHPMNRAILQFMLTIQRPATEGEICKGIAPEDPSVILALALPMLTPSEAAAEEARRRESAGAFPHSIELHEQLLAKVKATGRRFYEVSDELEEQLSELQSWLDVLTAEPDRPDETYPYGELHEYLTFVAGLLRIITDPCPPEILSMSPLVCCRQLTNGSKSTLTSFFP